MKAMTKTLISILTLVVISTAAFIIVASQQAEVASFSPSEEPHNAIVTINNQRILVETARSAEQKSRGLSNRDSLPAGTGMLFIFNEPKVASFWMYQMRFPIDIIFINNGRIVNIEKNAPVPQPGTPPEDLPNYESAGIATHVLEINAGESDLYGFSVGDGVTIETFQGI